MISRKLRINNRNFLKYKFFNSLFLGTSIGSIFTIYTPLEPSVYSIGGIILAVGMLFVATLYSKILNINYFYKLKFLVKEEKYSKEKKIRYLFLKNFIQLIL